MEPTQFAEAELKRTLEGLAQHLFGEAELWKIGGWMVWESGWMPLLPSCHCSLCSRLLCKRRSRADIESCAY